MKSNNAISNSHENDNGGGGGGGGNNKMKSESTGSVTNNATNNSHEHDSGGGGGNDNKNEGKKSRSVLKIMTPKSKEEMAAKEAHIRKILWRDFIFLVLAFLGARFMSFVELNASRAELRGAAAASGGLSPMPSNFFWSNNCGVIDTGYILTTPLYNFLKNNRFWNDLLAGINSLILFAPGIYTSYITLWKGDFDLAFRYFFCHLLRSLCGWFTYLPPDPSYLPSNYDFPDIWQCLLIKDCSKASKPEALPFVSFFSGHVSTMVCTANHMYVRGHKKLGIFCHALNVFQIIRFLATRGHYSIDIIIAWYVAIYVSNPAGRLGRYFSRGTKVEDVMPENATQAFETLTGIYDAMVDKQDLQKVLQRLLEDDSVTDEIMLESTSETTATILAEELERMAAAPSASSLKKDQ